MLTWLIELIYMIGQSIFTVAFDTDFIIKIIHYHSTFYIAHDKRNGTVFYKDNSQLLCVKNTETVFYT